MFRNNAPRTERLQIMLADEELRAIDEWQFNNRMPSRAAAIRELIRRGMLTSDYNEANLGAKTTEFGVIDEPPPGSMPPSK